MELYLGAMTDLRAVNDLMWLAGALEGLSTAILIVLKQGLSIEDYLGKEISLSAQVSGLHSREPHLETRHGSNTLRNRYPQSPSRSPPSASWRSAWARPSPCWSRLSSAERLPQRAASGWQGPTTISTQESTSWPSRSRGSSQTRSVRHLVFPRGPVLSSGREGWRRRWSRRTMCLYVGMQREVIAWRRQLI